MMRQYELVEKVRSYDPKADEALLNRAYVYAMQAHGTQKRASGDPYFAHPLEVAAILTDLQARRRDHRHGAAARRHRGHRRHPRGDRPAVRPRDRRAGRRRHQAPPLDLVSKKAEQAENLRKFLLAISKRHPRPAGEARRPPAQHAHAGAHEAGSASASPRRRSTSMPRWPAAWACTASARSWRNSPSAGSIRWPATPSSAKLAELREQQGGAVEEIRGRSATSWRGRHRRRGLRAARRSPMSIWRKLQRQSISL